MAAWLSRSKIQRNGSWRLPCLIAVARVYSRGASSATAFQDKPRGVEDLPHVSPLELIYRMVFQGFYNRIHELQIYEKQLYGPIYRDGLKSVSVNTPKLLEEIMRNDEKFPCRGDMSVWKDYRDMKGIGYGPFTEEGDKWYNLRVMLNKRMLRPKDSEQYGEIITDVVTDFTKRIHYLCQCSPTGDLVTNMANELYLFSLEGIASILFETRLGCLEKEIPAAKNLIDKKMEAIQQCVDNSQDVKGEYLTYLLSNTEMSLKDVYGSITELLLAGVDTTSNTLTWTLHLLSSNPQSQDRLYKEGSTFIPADRIPTAAEITRMPYLRAVVKEALRMYPVVPMNARIITEKNIVIGGYQFPKKTSFAFCHYAISHDEDTFPEPFTFKPERWLRDGRERPNPFGSIPFGFGVRGCVGRRIAELEMYMVVFQLIRLFEIKPDPAMGKVKCLCRTVLIPDQPVNLRFVDRRCENAV
ncbi:sterol 26-hydroxylase, mitochondrial isoform X2 [Seriola aureovittata]|uniref:sterol 26-hydroxylase, mitochondrial isoform X2 n=1 Tax=Seriola aureovittata TaxID=2871759 RepID=UPI0024BD6C65|nr:sterol 26-hydroxylase, mitochondrial isoform X2 [Seriola aureovittata]